jgi:2-polyprenyl-6-methoxyphenol hydroxylase-like FAD-dependent oxidoreductase
VGDVTIQERGAPPGREHAIVVGASMAGLLAARVLSGHFARVTVVERDRLPEGPAFRKGVPQSRHLHALLARGAALMERLFPGLQAELRAAGAVTVAWPGDVLMLTRGGWCRRFRPGISVISCSRELLEWHVRRRLATSARIHLLQECDAVGLVPSEDGTAVTGVRVRSRPGRDPRFPAPEDLRADLVVDASGRDSRTPEWLAALGYPRPQQSRITSFLGYSSRYYAPLADFQDDWRVLFLQANPPADVRGGGLFPVEGNRWLVTLAGAGRDYPPTDDAGFLEFARGLRSPILYETIRRAQPLTPVVGYQRTDNQLRHYERLRRFPERLLVLGDAVCAFNPIYGQGMTVAAQAAVLLHHTLREQERRQPSGELAGLARRFQRRLAKANATPWLMATGEDLRVPGTEGARPDLSTRLMHRYLDRVLAVATENATVNRAFLEVLNLLRPPTRLFEPSVLVRVLRGRRMPESLAPPTRTA